MRPSGERCLEKSSIGESDAGSTRCAVSTAPANVRIDTRKKGISGYRSLHRNRPRFHQITIGAIKTRTAIAGLLRMAQRKSTNELTLRTVRFDGRRKNPSR